MNADYLVSKNAAVLVRDEDLPTQMVSVVADLLESPEKLESMKAAMRQLAQPDAAEKIMDLLRESAGIKD